MGKVYEGNLDASKLKVGIVVSRFNDLIGKKLLEGALDCLTRHGAKEKAIDIVWTPGSLEIPMIAKKLTDSGKYNAVICLGAVIRGGTPHFGYVANEAAKGVAKLALESGIPVVFGILTTDTLEQAIERAGGKAGNRGWRAALSAIESANLMTQL